MKWGLLLAISAMVILVYSVYPSFYSGFIGVFVIIFTFLILSRGKPMTEQEKFAMEERRRREKEERKRREEELEKIREEEFAREEGRQEARQIYGTDEEETREEFQRKPAAKKQTSAPPLFSDDFGFKEVGFKAPKVDWITGKRIKKKK